MALIDRIYELNRRIEGRIYYQLYVNGIALGFVDEQIFADLPSDLFILNHHNKRVDMTFEITQRLDFEQRLEDFFRSYFVKKGLSGWRDEKHAVRKNFADETLFLLERAALSFLGLTGYGVHINGYVRKGDKLLMWVAKRSSTKPTSPGKLDQIAAGGQPYNISVWENVIKECEEEASIPRNLAIKAKPVSCLTYFYDMDIGMRPDVIFNYDLRLPEDFIPHVNDDEVESFQLYPIEELLTLISEQSVFKLNSAVVIIDFAIRHGIITPEHTDYLALQEGMHQRWRF